MSYNKVFELIENDSRLKSFMTNVASGIFDMTYIMTETLKLLEDDSPFYNMISDSNKKALCIMLNQYFDSCYEIYMNNIKLDNILNYGKIEVYRIEARNGIRYATVKEVEQGVRGLIAENIYPAGEKEYKLLCLLQWTISGSSYYFRQAGYKLNYGSDGKPTNTFFEMIFNCAMQLKEMFDLCNDKKKVDKCIKIIKKMKQKHGYKYASYEKDEVTEDITIKQLVMNVYKIFPRNSSNPEYRKALALAIKSYKNNKKLTPLEVSRLREIYDKHALDLSSSRGHNNEVNSELKDKCEELLAKRYDGSINQNHFAFTIINSLRANNYTKCSPKQLAIVDEAYKQLNRDISGNDNSNNIISEDEINSSLDIYGLGLTEMFDEEDA